MAKVDKNDRLGYGISLFTDFSKNVKRSSGVDRVIESVVGILIDRLWYAPSYGIDLPWRINHDNPRTYNGLAAEAERAVLNDERVATCTITISQPDANNAVSVIVSGETIDGGDFTLKATSDLNVQDFKFTR